MKMFLKKRPKVLITVFLCLLAFSTLVASLPSLFALSTPYITVSQSSVVPGEAVHVKGHRFPEGKTVDIYLNRTDDEHYMGSAVTNKGGVFTFTFTMTANYPGIYKVIVHNDPDTYEKTFDLVRTEPLDDRITDELTELENTILEDTGTTIPNMLKDLLTIKEVTKYFPGDNTLTRSNTTHLFNSWYGVNWYRIEISSNRAFQVKAVYIDLDDPDGTTNIRFYSGGSIKRGVKLIASSPGSYIFPPHPQQHTHIESTGWDPGATEYLRVELLSHLGLKTYPAGPAGQTIAFYLTLEGGADGNESLSVRAIVETALDATVELDWD